jgi:hypothetical protein
MGEEMIPMSAFGPRIPDSDFLPGARVTVYDSKGFRGRYTVLSVDDGDDFDVYQVRRNDRGPGATLTYEIDSGEWRFGARCQKVKVKGTW